MARSIGILSATVLLIVGGHVANGRSWRAVIDHEIYKRSCVELARFELRTEVDPFYFVEGGHMMPPHRTMPPVATQAPVETDSPAGVPTLAPNADVWITPLPSNSPTLFPTQSPAHSEVPSDSPSFSPTHGGPTNAPTIREKNVDGNGGCNPGTFLYQVNMRDSWGDGWDGTELKIIGVEDQEGEQDAQDQPEQPKSTVTKTTTEDNDGAVVTVTETIEINAQQLFSGEKTQEKEGTKIDPLGQIFQGGLRRGYHSHADICLKPRRCYDVTVLGGGFLDEVSWDIRPVDLGVDVQDLPPIVEGGAPSDCSFSIPDANGDVFCPRTCSNTMNPQHTAPPKVLQNPLVDSVGGVTVPDNTPDEEVGSDASTSTITDSSNGGVSR